MKLKELYGAIDAYAPFSLSLEYIKRGNYDNSGLLIDCGEEVKGALFALDLSSRAVGEAKKRGYNCIVTHHPAIYSPLKRLGEGSILECARAGISVISAHLNLDAAEGGIDESLMRALGGKKARAVMEKLTAGGYGRVYDVEQKPLEGFVSCAKETLSAKRVLVYGEKPVRRVASFCGAGFSEEAIEFALQNGADTLVSSDGPHHRILAAAEGGLNVVLFTHYCAELYGFSRFAEKIINKMGGAGALFTDERFL